MIKYFQVFSSIFKYFLKNPKKRIIRVCLNRIESMSLLCLFSRGQCGPCVVCGEEGLEEMEEDVCILCAISMEDG
jgi:hypothetical protein